MDYMALSKWIGWLYFRELGGSATMEYSAAGLGCGQIVLTIAVLSILITAPLGAFLIEHTYKKWLKKEQRAY